MLPIRAFAGNDNGQIRLRTVVIDAGHGGHDPGCISYDRRTNEKSITLAVAKTLADKIRAEHPDVKVILTRSSDVFVTLNGRADIANKANADLFMSIHVNAAPNKSRQSANGYSIHVLGQYSSKNKDMYALNMDLCKRENSVITMEDDYQTSYQGFDPNDPESFIFFSLMQNTNLNQSLQFADEVDKALGGAPIAKSRGISQNAFLVLWRTTMPSALIELGFITNSEDLAQFRKENYVEKTSEALLKAFDNYKKKYDGVGEPQKINKEEPVKEHIVRKEGTAVRKEPAVPEIIYGVQIAASGKKMKSTDPWFKGLRPQTYPSGSLNKYVIVTGENPADAREKLSTVKSKFPQAFVVKIEGEKVSRF
ncbi:MAG: N-acetylmuramoyl-L-alanine amidase [Bacteroidales bacterium]|nr:N-acetylmuramoyl-L-alanine amidase [Bacteroidales bacterium]